MNIEDCETEVQFGDLVLGDVFRPREPLANTYLRIFPVTDEHGIEYTAVDLVANALAYGWTPDCCVVRLKAKLILGQGVEQAESEVDSLHAIFDKAGLAMNAKGRMVLADRIRACVELLDKWEPVTKSALAQYEYHKAYIGLSGEKLGHATCAYERACRATEAAVRESAGQE